MNETHAAITWTSTDDTVNQTERVHRLERPFAQVLPAHNMTHFVAESLDRTNIERYVVGDGAYELVGTIDLDQDGHSLIDLIKAGTEGKTLTYYPDLGDADVNFACDLIAPLSPHGLDLDPKTGQVRGDHTVELRLRRTNQSDFQPLNKGKDVVFWYRAGDSMEVATFSRADTASRTTKGFGQLSTAATGIARVSWFSSESTGGPRMRQALWLEDARTNLVPESENFGASTWVFTGGTLTSEQADPYGGTAAWLVADNSTTAIRILNIDVAIPSTEVHAVSFFVREGTTSSTEGFHVRLRNVTASADYFASNVTWSSGIPTITIGTGSTYADPEQFAGGWWRGTGIATGSTNTGDTHAFQFVPAVDAAGNVGDGYAFGAQVE